MFSELVTFINLGQTASASVGSNVVKSLFNCKGRNSCFETFDLEIRRFDDGSLKAGPCWVLQIGDC